MEEIYRLESEAPKSMLAKFGIKKDNKKIVTLYSRQLFVEEGESTICIELQELKSLTINGVSINDVEDVDLPIEVFVQTDHQELTLSGEDFEVEAYIGFLNKLQEVYADLFKSPEEKIVEIEEKCKQALVKDQELKKSLLKNLKDIFSSIYRVYSLSNGQSLSEVREDVVFSSLTKHGYYVYFVRDRYKDVGPENIEVAKNLIETSQANLDIVEARILSYHNVKDHLVKVKAEYKKKQELLKAAQKLEKLQNQNMENSASVDTGMAIDGMDAKILSQLSDLTDSIRDVETLDKSLVLKEYVSLFEEYSFSYEKVEELNKNLTK